MSEETIQQRSDRIRNQLQAKYPDKAAYDLDGRGLHFVCEVEPVTDHPEYDRAVEVMISTKPHKHLKMTQYYTVLSGELELHVDTKIINLHPGDKYVIKPGTIHWAKSDNETWVELYSEPGWTKEDHILIPQTSNFHFLQKYQELQYSIMFDKLIRLSFATIGYSEIDPSVFWNLALTNDLLSNDQLTAIESTLTSLRRRPTIYFENRRELAGLAKQLEAKSYKKSFEDCWQFWNGGEINERHFKSIRKVNTVKELATFITTFNSCYRKDDPQNPYGELGEYLTITESVWHKHHTTNRLEYFLVYKDDQPVGVSTLTNYGGIGYISNVGSLTEVRGQGFGKAATLYCIQQSIKKGNCDHCLATEEGHYPNEFYKRIGFSVKFTALGYTKSQ